MSKPFFTSDLHLLHRNVIEYCGRPWTFEEQTEQLIDRWNAKVGEHDIVYHLGDFTFAGRKQAGKIARILQSLNGQKYFIRGNHDSDSLWNQPEVYDQVNWLKDYHETSVEGQKIILCHYPHASWNGMHRGSWMLHGHCVDMETELLTTEGWKRFGEFTVGDVVPTYNCETGGLERQSIEQVFNPLYSGTVYTLKGKSVNARMTEDHRIVGLTAHSGKYVECLAKSPLKCKIKIIHSVFSAEGGLSLTDDQLRLYVYCTADGSLKEETGLWRLRVKKEHKKAEIARTLNALGIAFNRYDKGAYSSFNFYFNSGFQPKGLDTQLRGMTDEQFSVFIGAYALSDGSWNGKGVLLTTAKKQEADLIQELAVTHGWSCTSLQRDGHGFSTKPSWQLSVYPRQSAICGGVQEMDKEFVKDEPFWCVKTGNGNFFIRRKGKVHLTGNCHGSYQGDGKILDVGIDNHPDHQVWSWEEIKAFMDTREIVSVDHHKEGGRE